MHPNLASAFIITLLVSFAAAKCPAPKSILPCRCFPFSDIVVGCQAVTNFTDLKVTLAGKFDQDFILAITTLKQRKIEKSTVLGLRIMSLRIFESTVEEIEKDAFADIANSLSQLSISSSNLTSVPVPALSGLSKLQRLEISNAKVTSIRKSDIDQLPADIYDINLSFNNLVNIENGAFTHLSQLVSISLVQCKLNKLPDNWLPAHIVVLDLTGNDFTNVPTKGFSTMKYVSVSMNSNKIETLPAEADMKSFLNRGNTLNLYQNPLQCTCSWKWLIAFKDATKINRLKGICHEDAHRRLKRIEKLESADFADC